MIYNKTTEFEGYYSPLPSPQKRVLLDIHKNESDHNEYIDSHYATKLNECIGYLDPRFIKKSYILKHREENINKANYIIDSINDDSLKNYPSLKIAISKIREYKAKIKRKLKQKELVKFYDSYELNNYHCCILIDDIIPTVPGIGKPKEIKGKWKIEVTFEPDPEELLKLLVK